jgi:hypothetical protein
MYAATTPTVIDGNVYDRWAIASLTQTGHGLARLGSSVVPRISIKAVLVKYRIRSGDGLPEYCDLSDVGGSEAVREIAIDDLAAEIGGIPDGPATLAALTAVVMGYASGEGLL